MGVNDEFETLWLEAVRVKRFAVLFDGGMRLVPRSDSGKFLDWAEDRGLILLGAEGFKYTNGSLTPVSECIIDYSNGDPSMSIEFHRKVISSDAYWSKVDFIDFTIKPMATR